MSNTNQTIRIRIPQDVRLAWLCALWDVAHTDVSTGPLEMEWCFWPEGATEVLEAEVRDVLHER